MQRNKGEDVYIYQNQDFNKIREWCLKEQLLFEDPYFKLDSKHEWRRPWEITRDPKLYVSGTAQYDVLQGEIGDCWMLAAIALLGMQPDLVKKVIPPDQGFSYQYAGIFHFRFWRFGKWYDVVIDDRLPTRKGRLVFTKSVSHNEFWTPLLEKAYCKIMGGEYKVADAGNLCEALEDFTGGVVQQFLLQNVPPNFPNFFLKSVARRSLVGCFIDNLKGTYQTQTAEGLVRGHSYSVTGAKRVNIPQYGNIVLVRVRNPWGQFEWTGPWSDGSQEWNSVSQSTKQKLGLVYDNDGEFWMSYSDFVTNFQWMDICHLSPNAFVDANGQTAEVGSWQLNAIRGNWVRGVTDGGYRKLYSNPQMKITLSEADDDNNDGLCSVIIALLQKASLSNDEYFEIGFKVYQLNEYNINQASLDRYFFQNNRSVAGVPLKSVREVSGRFNLPPGSYCIIPFTYRESREREFILRIYSEKRTTMGYMDSTVGLSPMDVIGSESPPMNITDVETKDVQFDEQIRHYFDKVSGLDGVVDWKELKNILDFVVKNNIQMSDEKKEGWLHYLFNLVGLSSVYNKMFGSSRKSNAFETLGAGGFSNDLCRSMVALLDFDHSGELGYNEFQDLFSEIKKWKTIYELHSDESTGYLESSSMKEALEAAGFNFSGRILTDIIHRYSTKDGNISFDDFLHCTMQIKCKADFFKSKEESSSHKAEFTFEEFMDKAIYC